MTEAKKLEEQETPPDPPPGRRFVQYKPKGARTIWINIVLPDGHRETFDTHTLVRSKANGVGRSRLAQVCKERGVLSIAAEVHARGGMTSQDRHHANNKARAEGRPVPFPIGNRGGAHANGAQLPLQAGPLPVEAPADDGWTSFVRTYEQRCVQFFLRVTELMLLGQAENPQTFVNHIKATVVETIQGARKAKPGPRPRGD